jgi:hypothetical protein
MEMIQADKKLLKAEKKHTNKFNTIKLIQILCTIIKTKNTTYKRLYYTLLKLYNVSQIIIFNG